MRAISDIHCRSGNVGPFLTLVVGGSAKLKCGVHRKMLTICHMKFCKQISGQCAHCPNSTWQTPLSNTPCPTFHTSAHHCLVVIIAALHQQSLVFQGVVCVLRGELAPMSVAREICCCQLRLEKRQPWIWTLNASVGVLHDATGIRTSRRIRGFRQQHNEERNITIEYPHCTRQSVA